MKEDKEREEFAIVNFNSVSNLSEKNYPSTKAPVLVSLDLSKALTSYKDAS